MLVKLLVTRFSDLQEDTDIKVTQTSPKVFSIVGHISAPCGDGDDMIHQFDIEVNRETQELSLTRHSWFVDGEDGDTHPDGVYFYKGVEAFKEADKIAHVLASTLTNAWQNPPMTEGGLIRRFLPC